MRKKGKYKGLTCAYCGRNADTWDHVVPRSQGGANSRSNMMPCCSLCNGTKGDNSYGEFVAFMQYVQSLGIVFHQVTRARRLSLKKSFHYQTGIDIGHSFSQKQEHYGE